MNKYKVMLDMDGVLADFDKHTEVLFPEVHKLKQELSAMIAELPEPYKGAHYKDVAILLKGKQTDPQLHKVKKFLHFVRDQVYENASVVGFFFGLPKMPDADELFAGVEALCGTPGILTAPLQGSPTCVMEKKAWVDKHYAGRFDIFIAEKDKHIYATPTTILIDDTPKKIRAFNEAGGIGIFHANAKESLRQLAEVVQR